MAPNYYIDNYHGDILTHICQQIKLLTHIVTYQHNVANHLYVNMRSMRDGVHGVRRVAGRGWLYGTMGQGAAIGFGGRRMAAASDLEWSTDEETKSEMSHFIPFNPDMRMYERERIFVGGRLIQI
ncbi:hypothetical protein Fot_28516 [Forsythia ovata]|uniref:Uncharacterized protein n=1 Tax=Forsythia ovata TaxID=205694 RepID=A0ABD1TP76_9LAMI